MNNSTFTAVVPLTEGRESISAFFSLRLYFPLVIRDLMSLVATCHGLRRAFSKNSPRSLLVHRLMTIAL